MLQTPNPPSPLVRFLNEVIRTWVRVFLKRFDLFPVKKIAPSGVAIIGRQFMPDRQAFQTVRAYAYLPSRSSSRMPYRVIIVFSEDDRIPSRCAACMIDLEDRSA